MGRSVRVRLREKSADTKPIRVPDAKILSSRLVYTEHHRTPGTSVSLYTAVDADDWVEVDNGDPVPDIRPGCEVRGRVTLRLEDCNDPNPAAEFDLRIEVDVAAEAT